MSSVVAIGLALNMAMYPDAYAEGLNPLDPVGFFATEETGAQLPPAAPVVVDEEEVRLLAATAWGEARSEGEDGMRAVAHVMVNRVGDRFGEDLSTVILAPKQFSVWNRGDPNRRHVLNLVRDPSLAPDAEWDTAQRVAREVLSGQSVDPTGGALFYHTRAVRPRWAGQGEGRQVIGSHIFYSDVPDRARRRAPGLIEVAQLFRGGGGERASQTRQRGPRAGRVNGVIQYAPAASARQPLPSESANAAATPTIDGTPITALNTAAPAVAGAP